MHPYEKAKPMCGHSIIYHYSKKLPTNPLKGLCYHRCIDILSPKVYSRILCNNNLPPRKENPRVNLLLLWNLQYRKIKLERENWSFSIKKFAHSISPLQRVVSTLLQHTNTFKYDIECIYKIHSP